MFNGVTEFIVTKQSNTCGHGRHPLVLRSLDCALYSRALFGITAELQHNGVCPAASSKTDLQHSMTTFHKNFQELFIK